MSLIGNLGLGFGPSGGGVCDYPSPNDVRTGVAYDFGLMIGDVVLPAAGHVRQGDGYGSNGTELTGTDVLPPVGDVASGVGYGASGTEFFGTLSSPTTFPPPVGNWPLQSASYEQILDAIRIQLMKYTGLDINRVREWYADTRPSYGDDPLLTYKPTTEEPFLHAGAGRIGSKMDFGIQVTIWYRYQSDDAGTHRQWGRQVYALRRAVISALHDHNVYTAYDPATGDPLTTATPLLFKPFEYVASSTVDKMPIMTDGKSVMNFVGGAVLMLHVPNIDH